MLLPDRVDANLIAMSKQFVHQFVVGVHVGHKISGMNWTAIGIVVAKQLLVVGKIGDRDRTIEGDDHKLWNLFRIQSPWR